MDIKKWEDVVVLWVNCLKLSTPISDLNDLRNGLFFTELIKILKPSDFESTTDRCTVSQILKLLDTQYPNFTLDSENIQNLDELSMQDLIAIASLLLHFSCVLDRRDVLTSPLCHRLPRNTQIQIRSYLENMKKEIPKQDFYQLIDKCIGNSQNKSTGNCCKPHTMDLNMQNRSPLQELLLHTPVKHRSFAKDREIKKLLSEIELERFEKADLQDELKCQHSKNIKLSKEVSDKSAEIMRLRSEIANLEALTLPSNEDQESAELQRRLRAEINSLEQYVAKLQNELYELYNDRDCIKEKLQKVEGQCTIWQEKSATAEEDFDNIIEKHKQQEVELNCLRSHCNELSALLEELKTSNQPNENCIDVSMADGVSGLQGPEDMACAVVEVQLRDVQKDNVELKNMLKECKENASRIEHQLIYSQDKFKWLEIDYQAMQLDNEQLIKKVSELEKTESALFDATEELEMSLKKITELSLDNDSLKEEINMLHQNLSTANESQLSIEAHNRLLCSEIESLQSKTSTLTADLQNKCDGNNALQQQMESLQLKYATLVEQYNKTDFNFQSVTLNLNKLNADVERSLQNLEELVFGADSQLDLKDKNKAFEKIISRLKDNTAVELENRKVLMKRIDCFEEINKKLRNDVDILNERETVSLQERRQLYDNLKHAESTIKVLEDTITLHVTKIDDLNNTILEMSNTLKDLEVLKNIVDQNQLLVTDLEQINDSLRTKLKLRCEERDENKTAQLNLQTHLEYCQHVIVDFEKQMEDLRNQLTASEGTAERHIQTIAELQTLKIVFEVQATDAAKQIAACKVKEDTLVQTISDLEVSKASLERQIADANTKIEQQKSKEASLQNELFVQEKQHQLLIKDLNLQIECYTKQIREIELDLQKSKFSCAAAEKDLQLIQITRDELLQQIELCKTDFNKRITAVEDTKKRLQSDFELSIKDGLEIQEQLLNKSKQYDQVITERDRIANEYQEVANQLQECKKKLTILDESCQTKDDVLSEATQNLLLVKLDSEVKAEHIINLQHSIDEGNLKIQRLENQIFLLNKENEELRLKTTELVNESELLENMKNSLQSKCSELESNGWKVVNELASKNQQLEDLLGKYNKYQEMTQAKLNNLEISLIQSKGELGELIDVKNKIEYEKNFQIKNLQEQIDELNDVIEEFNQREIENTEEIRNLKNELSDSIEKYTEVLELGRESEAENEFQITSLTENLHSIVAKYNALDITHADTVLRLEKAQAHLETLENTKTELEMKTMQQKVQFEEDYTKCVDNLNLQIQEKAKREAALQEEVVQTIKQLNTSEKSCNDLHNQAKKMCSELASLKNERTKLCQSLRMFKDAYQDLKNIYSSLKASHLEFLTNNTNSLKCLKVELVDHIDLLLTKNNSFSVTINELQEKVITLTTEQERVSAMHLEILDNKDKEIILLTKDNETFKDNMNKMLQDKEILEKRLSEERAKVRELQEATTASNEIIQECLNNIINIKCINEVLETTKGALENEILRKTDRIVELEKLKFKDHNKYVEDTNSLDTEIQTLTEKIKDLETKLSQNSFKNDELMLELCSVNQTLENLTGQYAVLQEVLTDEKEKKAELESDLVDNQSILENLQMENDLVQQEIIIAREEINELKEQLKLSLNERQTLALQIKFANEKIAEQNVHLHKKESDISELNAKMVLKLEECLELEKEKKSIQDHSDALSIELEHTKKHRDERLESQSKILSETENHLIRSHKNTLEVKDDLMKRIGQLQNENIKDKQLRVDLEKLLEGEKMAKSILEIRVIELDNEKMKFSQILSSIKHNICVLGSSLSEKPVEVSFNQGDNIQELDMSDVENISKNIELIQNKIMVLVKENENCVSELSKLQQEQSSLNSRISDLVEENRLTLQEKQKLFDNYNSLYQEKVERERDLRSFNDIQLEHSMLQAKYDQVVSCNKNNITLKTKNEELLEQIVNLEKQTTAIYDVYKKYAGYSNIYKAGIQKIIEERSLLEKVVANLRQVMVSVQVKLLHMNEEREKGKLMDQMYSFETILEDIHKQFLRSSKKIHEIILHAVQVPLKICDSIQTNKIPLEDDFKINFDDEYEALIDCRDRATNLLEQMMAFDGSLGGRHIKIQKETLRSSSIANLDAKISDDELKKRNVVLKQRLTLAENAKSNLEKKIKQLRLENKALSEHSENTNNDITYKTLLQEYIQSKEQYENIISENKVQYNTLVNEFKEFKAKNKFIPDQIKYEKEIKSNNDAKLEKDVVKLREAYGNVMSDNSRLDLENATLRKLLEDRTSQLSELKLIKETYEKLLEENNKLSMELDTVKYKRNKDREALFEALENVKKEDKKIQGVRNEYEGKLEKMKDRMLQLYKEEMNKEIQKHQSDISEKVALQKTVDLLKHNLRSLQIESVRSKSSEPPQNLDMSLSSRDSFFISTIEATSTKSSDRDGVYSKAVIHRRAIEDRRYSTLPKQMSVIQEGFFAKRNTVSAAPDGREVEMEDEDEDLFNNKYLTDLKEGRCTVAPSGRESNASRMSELIWRNSLCPPHLKSSYPAETQFNTPGRYKEDDIKSGAGDFNDSMSTRLLPTEKPRKKDFGTTSYKRPGPPTPSKNGGRASLQSNELREILQESNECKTPKRVTPNRLKQLFLGKGNQSTKENSELLYDVCVTRTCRSEVIPKSKVKARRIKISFWTCFLFSLVATTLIINTFILF